MGATATLKVSGLRTGGGFAAEDHREPIGLLLLDDPLLLVLSRKAEKTRCDEYPRQ